MTRRVSALAARLFSLAAAFSVCLGFWAAAVAGARPVVA